MNIKIVWHNYYITVLVVCKYTEQNFLNHLPESKKEPPFTQGLFIYALSIFLTSTALWAQTQNTAYLFRDIPYF